MRICFCFPLVYLFACLLVRSFLACRQGEEINDNVGFIYYGWI